MGTELIKKPSNEIASRVQEIAAEDQDDLAVMAYVVQVAATIHLSKMRKLEESKIPIGAPSFEWTITTTTKRVDLANPWISFSLHNDGPGNVKVKINTLEGDISSETTIDSGEVMSRDFKYPVMNRLYLVTESSTATVRVYAEEGRKWQ